MPLGKYHCDYCNTEFQDTSFARKRHLQCLQHLRAKALWYDSLKDTNPHKGKSSTKTTSPSLNKPRSSPTQHATAFFKRGFVLMPILVSTFIPTTAATHKTQFKVLKIMFSHHKLFQGCNCLVEVLCQVFRIAEAVPVGFKLTLVSKTKGV
ncbi:hypothetical protein LWI29_027647 [Acer saccharum]|uniref:U1-C C2H2-type zinc finger domain-containing protein n=1 Tax=Acer saccharum TaxID=4024 RepID=A0AA39SHD3_ACESA|nr:hypothetical protein LWI29_027647 [Acer saccharum]